MIVLDTNVVSELMRDRPQLRVLSWLDDQLASTLFVTAITEPGPHITYSNSVIPVGMLKLSRIVRSANLLVRLLNAFSRSNA